MIRLYLKILKKFVRLILGCSYTICAFDYITFLHNSHWITFPTKSYQLLLLVVVSFLYSSIRWVFFHWCLNDNKSPLVYKTCVIVLADLNNAVVWMVSNRSPICNFQSLHQAFGERSNHSRSNNSRIIITTAFFVPWQHLNTSLSFLFLWFLLIYPLGWQNPLYSRFSFFVNYH